VNTFYCLEEWRGEQRISPLGDKFTPGGQSLPPGVELRMGLWGRCYDLLFSTIFGEKNWSQKPMLWSYFCKN
jgi:hypothetical protein